tara:strand:+ start:176 stop:394 length:219 start_codon:yes stop_codon:yes gene_type:complete
MTHYNADCYCHTCNRAFHHLGIAAHRAAHRTKREDCKIQYSDDRLYQHTYSVKATNLVEPDNDDTEQKETAA